jgi:hypothetical protein
VMAIKGAMALATRVESDKEGDGFGNKSDGDKGGEQAMAIMATATVMEATWAMAMATRVVCEKDGNCNSGKSNGNGDEGGRRVTVTRACRAHGNNLYGYGGRVLKIWYLKLTKVHIFKSI